MLRLSRRSWLAFVSLGLAARAAPLAAQESSRGPVVGVGITMPDVGLLLPINVSPHFRLEPYVLFYSTRSDYPTTSDTLWTSHTRVGLGVFSVGHPGESAHVYVGARGGLLWGSNRINGATFGKANTDDNGWFAGGVIGGEYSPVPRIGLGGEAMISYEHTSPSPSGSTSVNLPSNLYARAWYSTGSLVVRFYP
jgi:hypothetical protein